MASVYTYGIFTLLLKQYTVKPVLRGHLWDKEKMVFQDRWPRKRGSIHMKINTGDCVMEVTT